MIRDLIVQTPYQPGERLPPEREIAEMLNVTRTVVREALIMLEIKGLVDVRRGAGIYVLDNADAQSIDSSDANHCNDAGPFELLQARQLLESNIAEFAALQATREDIVKMRQALQLEERELASSEPMDQRAVTCSFIWRLLKPRITACWWSCFASHGSGVRTTRCGSSFIATSMILITVKSGWSTTSRSWRR